MTKNNFFSKVAIIGLTINISINCHAQEDKFVTPCFDPEHPKVISLPDSLDLKSKNCYAWIDVYCLFDSNGIILRMKPFCLFIMNKDDKIMKQYNYYLKESNNMSESEALKYANWAIQTLPNFTKIKRKPAHIKCNETITNENSLALEYRLE